MICRLLRENPLEFKIFCFFHRCCCSHTHKQNQKPGCSYICQFVIVQLKVTHMLAHRKNANQYHIPSNTDCCCFIFSNFNVTNTLRSIRYVLSMFSTHNEWFSLVCILLLKYKNSIHSWLDFFISYFKPLMLCALSFVAVNFIFSPTNIFTISLSIEFQHHTTQSFGLLVPFLGVVCIIDSNDSAIVSTCIQLISFIRYTFYS